MGGDTLTAIATGGASELLGGDSGGGGSGSGSSTPKNAIGAVDRFSTPDLFKPYQKFMPTEYSGSAPIQDPTSILNAYMNNMPAFLNASRSMKS